MSYRRPYVQTLTIAAASDTSDSLPIRDAVLVGFKTPAALTTTSFTFEVCDTNDGTFLPLYDSAGNLVTVTVTVDRAYTLTANEADAIAPWGYMKFVAADGAEGTARSIVTTKK